jgi:hypothetical protein
MTTTEQAQPTRRGQPVWLVYLSLLLAGLLLLADAYGLTLLSRWTARLGVALVFSALSLIIGRGRTAGYIAAVIIWLAVLATLIV